MRISTTSLLLTCTVVFCSAFNAMAQGPVYTITNIKHACGDQPNGAFTIHVTAAVGTLNFVVAAPGYFKNTTVSTYTLPFDFDVTGTTAGTGLFGNVPAGGARTYNILVSDDNDNTIQNQNIFNFA